ncbi:synapse-associated protein 1-like isoform X2 [Lepisosteus oculatus]|uniref:synapse-associated protein 1-like isoform X2 n=1 Tax=Lepisosteus oculatus TaxID=7918 RepID=UPI0035F51023
MFKSLPFGSWLRASGGDGQSGSGGETVPGDVSVDEQRSGGTAAGEAQKEPRAIGTYLFSAAALASRKVAETAQNLRRSVEGHPIIDRTILGDFKKEQERFLQEKQQTKLVSSIGKARLYSFTDPEAAVPPWSGCSDEETVKQQILALSLDRRNFLRDPPAGVHFPFDSSQATPVAMATLREDSMLSSMRFELVPRQVKEEVFWRNYFYRVSLIKQAAHLSSLTQEHRETRRLPGSQASAELPHPVPTAFREAGGAPEPVSLDSLSASPPDGEFISDTFRATALSQEDVIRAREQLGMGGTVPSHTGTDSGDIPEWEQELQKELQGFDLAEEGVPLDEDWEVEIEEMLQGYE